jgi:YD repeat-containing protein
VSLLLVGRSSAKVASEKAGAGGCGSLLAIAAIPLFCWVSCSGPSSNQPAGGTAGQSAPNSGARKERYYRDSHGAIISETDAEDRLSRLRSKISSMPDPAERAYMEGSLQAMEKEWARIKQQGPIER